MTATENTRTVFGRDSQQCRGLQHYNRYCDCNLISWHQSMKNNS